MAKDTSFQELKKNIRENTPDSLYLFFGEERYLRDLYAKKLEELIDDAGFPELNRISVDSDSLADLPEQLEGFPMMTDRRIVIVRDSGLFKKADESMKEYLSEFFKSVPDDTIVLFIENEVDKRSALYKAISKYGKAVEFAPLSESDTLAWIIREANARNLKISKQNAEYMLTICDNTLGSLENEINKLSGYCTEEILKSDIERLVSKSLQAKVFDLCDYMMEKNADGAVSLLAEFKTVKESAFKILYILFSTFDKMLRARLMQDKGASNSEIASAIKVPPFIAGKYIKGAKAFTIAELSAMTASVADVDLSIKRGEADDWTALEQYVYGYFSK